MDTSQSEKHITHQSRMRKSLDDLVNTPNPFVFFFKIWRLLRVINNEGMEVSRNLQTFMDRDKRWFPKHGVIGLFYDVFWENSEEYRSVKNPETRKKSRKRCFRLKTRNEWKKLPFKNWILSKFPDILDQRKTKEYDKLRCIREYYEKKGAPQLKDLVIIRRGKWEIDYDLSESAKRGIFEKHFSDEHILRKILTYGRRNDLRREEDHRCPYYDRIDSDRIRRYSEEGIREIDEETKKLIKEYYEIHGKVQYNAHVKRTLDTLRKVFRNKCLEVEQKIIVSEREALLVIVSITDSVLAPIFLPLIASKLARGIRGVISKTEIEQFAYLLSNVWADSYEEYVTLHTFFSRLILALDVHVHFLQRLFRYGTWTVFWLLSFILAPLAFFSVLAAAFWSFAANDISVARGKLSSMDIVIPVVAGFVIFLCAVIGGLAVKQDFFVLQYYKDRQFTSGTRERGFLGTFRSGLPIKTSLLDVPEAGSGNSATEKDEQVREYTQTCYSLSCVLEKRNIIEKELSDIRRQGSE